MFVSARFTSSRIFASVSISSVISLRTSDALGVGAFDGVHGDHRMVAGGDYGHVRAVDGAHSESGLEPDGVLGIERLLLQLAFHAFSSIRP